MEMIKVNVNVPFQDYIQKMGQKSFSFKEQIPSSWFSWFSNDKIIEKHKNEFLQIIENQYFEEFPGFISDFDLKVNDFTLQRI